MAHRLAAFVVVLTVFHAPVAAQEQPTTLRDIVKAMSFARDKSRLAEAMPAIDRRLQGHLDVLNGSDMLDFTAEQLAAAVEGPRLSALARLKSGLAPPHIVEALNGIKGLRNNEVREALEATTSTAEARTILWPVTTFQAEQLDRSIANSVAILRKYERKFGPDSARLNGPEVLLNYGLQRVRGFGPNGDGEPGPFEAIASYSPTYITYAAGEAQMVSVSEFGLRRYFFGAHWGAAGWKGLLRPAFLTFGVAVAGEEDGALKWPWKGDARLGGFFSWGELKVAYVVGDDQRFMVSRQFQLVPWAF